MEYDHELFEMFDLSPQGFPWTEARRDVIIRRRNEDMDEELFFDALLKLAGIDAHSVYPPRDVPTFHHLVNAILNTSWDEFQQSCLIYYLLRHWEDGREKPFAQSKLLPPQFMFVSDAYYLLDVGRSEEAVPYLCDSRVLHEFTSKIMKTLSSISEPMVASKSLLRFVRIAKPTLDNAEDLDLYVNALCYSNITEAWLYQRSLPEDTPERERHISRIIMFCFHPKPRPEPLKTLLGFPFTAYEDCVVKTMALSPPDILSDASVAIFQNMISVRLIHSGHYSEAIQLDRQFANAGTFTGPAVKDASARRKETLEELMGVIPVVQRRVLEMEIEEQEAEARKGKGPLIHGYANGHTNGDLAMSWEHINGSSSMMIDPMRSPPRNSAQPSSSSMTPLTASAAFRQAGSNTAVLKAFVHTSRLEGSPYLLTRSGSSTPIAALASANSPYARTTSLGQRLGSQTTGSPAPSRRPRASFGSYPVRSAASTPVAPLATPSAGVASKSITRPAFNIQAPTNANKVTSRPFESTQSTPNATPKPFTNPLSSATASGSEVPIRRVTPVKRPFGGSGGPGDRATQSVLGENGRGGWGNIPAPELADAEMYYDDGLDEDFVIQPALSRPRYNPPEVEPEPEHEPEAELEHEHESEQEHDHGHETQEDEPEPEPETEASPPKTTRTTRRRNKEAPPMSTKSTDSYLPGAFPSSPRVTRSSLAPFEEQESPKKSTGRRSTRGRVSRASSVAATDDGEDEPKPRRSSRLSHVPESSPPPQSPPRTTKTSTRKSKGGATGATKVKTRRQRDAIPEEAS